VCSSAGSTASSVCPSAEDVARWPFARISRGIAGRRSMPSGVEPTNCSRPSSCSRRTSVGWTHHCPIRCSGSCPWLVPTPNI